MKDHLQIEHDQHTSSLDIANGNNPGKPKAEEDETKQTKIAKRYNRKRRGKIYYLNIKKNG
jgi:hypothetical protein